jgi:hypothetical protein
MSSDDRVSGSSASAESRDIPKRVLGPIGRILRTGDPAATIDRLFISQHVADLRLIIAFAFIAVASVFAIGVVLSMVRAYCRDWGFIRGFWAFFAPVLGVFGAVLAWAYQAGSQRLGVVDSFACEISTLCRVATVVDSVGQSIEMFRHGSPGPDGATNAGSPTRHFTSQENYFPVFENNTRDLQSLEAHVVINITAFYTYMKAVRDSARSLFEMSAPPAQSAPGSNGASTSTPWREAARNVIYMMFLGLESARKAIHELVEFEPDEAERKIIILISELEAYCFLLDQFDESDTHYQRLQLREGDYREAKEDLDRLARDNVSNKSWEPALILMPELERRYDAVMNHSCHSSHYASIA